MSRKNFKVATAENGKTTEQNTKHAFATVNIPKDMTPTGKVKTLKDKETLRKEREQQYVAFRINALKRRAKRTGLTEEQTKVKIEELKNQLDTPNSYNVIIFFNVEDCDMVKQALLNEELAWKVISNSHVILDADQETLATLREIMPKTAKIHPYVKKKPPILPASELAKDNYVAKKTNKATSAKARRNAKKAENYTKKRLDGMAHNDHKLHAKLQKEKRMNNRRKVAKRLKMMQKRFQKAAQNASKKASGTTVQLKAKKGSESSKKASTNVKKAA